MILKIVTFLLLSALLSSAISATAMILTQPHETKATAKTCSGDPIPGGHPNILECSGDPIPGGHPSIGDQCI